LGPEHSILKVLVYFDLFRYPITKEEIYSFIDQPLNSECLNKTLDHLTKRQLVFQLGEFYSLQNDYSLAKRRRKGNALAAELLKKASGISGLLYKFPYVRGVGISGSVSKNFADEDADIDYFIITKANRLWIARTLMHLYKKNPFLKRRHQHYCMNYYVDEADLLIEEKNIYTATELFTLIPMAGNGSMKFFFEANSWALPYFPNHKLPSVKMEVKNTEPLYKKLTELFLNNKLGDWLDDYLLKVTTRRWKKKEDEGRLNTKGEIMGLKTGKHYSKNNPAHFHDWFMEKYERKLTDMKAQWGL
jgi:hypothetical protein